MLWSSVKLYRFQEGNIRFLMGKDKYSDAFVTFKLVYLVSFYKQFMFYFPNIYLYSVQLPCPQWTLMAEQNFVVPGSFAVQSRSEINDVQIEKQGEDESFEKLLEKELGKINNSKGRKVWSEQEDEKLIYMRQKGKTWEQIANSLEGGTQGNCIRRYQRLIRENEKWPKQVDQLIIRLFQQQNLSWPSIRDQVMVQYQKNYMIKSIRERYVNCLKKGICKDPWKLEEDLRLLNLVEKHQRKWQLIADQFGQRSERQLKNRYISTLEPIIKKIGTRNIKYPDYEEQAPFENSQE